MRVDVSIAGRAFQRTYAPATKYGRPVPANYVATFSFDGEDPAGQHLYRCLQLMTTIRVPELTSPRPDIGTWIACYNLL